MLKLVATFESRSRLRVKIFDAENRRYEVNVLPETTLTNKDIHMTETDYEFSVNTDIPGFSISRKSNREVNIYRLIIVGPAIKF